METTMNLDNDAWSAGESQAEPPSGQEPVAPVPNLDEPVAMESALPAGNPASNRTPPIDPAAQEVTVSVPWPAGPISPPDPVKEVEATPNPGQTDRPRGRVLIPMLSAFMGAVLAIGAVVGLGGFSASGEQATTTTVVGQSSQTLASSAGGTTTLQLRQANVDAVAVGEVVIPSIVSVQIGQDGPTGFSELGSGSGVVFDAEGHIITNDHVVSSGSAYQVVFADGRVYEATLVGTDPVTDLAVLKIGADNLVPIEFGTSDNLSVGDPTVAIGNPLGLVGGPSLTVGVLSAFDRQVQTSASDVLYGMLQTDAPITQGSSGGALVDETGRLIGITTAVGVSQIGVEGIGFATPVEIVERVVTELIANGKAGSAFLGIVGGTSFDTAVDGAQIPVGVEISDVDPAGAAMTAGLQAADVITSFEGQDVQTIQDLIVLLRRSHVGDKVQLMIERSGSVQSIDVVLGEG
jgi:putative serine protease PepD